MATLNIRLSNGAIEQIPLVNSNTRPALHVRGGGFDGNLALISPSDSRASHLRVKVNGVIYAVQRDYSTPSTPTPPTPPPPVTPTYTEIATETFITAPVTSNQLTTLPNYKVGEKISSYEFGTYTWLAGYILEIPSKARLLRMRHVQSTTTIYGGNGMYRDIDLTQYAGAKFIMASSPTWTANRTMGNIAIAFYDSNRKKIPSVEQVSVRTQDRHTARDLYFKVTWLT